MAVVTESGAIHVQRPEDFQFRLAAYPLSVDYGYMPGITTLRQMSSMEGITALLSRRSQLEATEFSARRQELEVAAGVASGEYWSPGFYSSERLPERRTNLGVEKNAVLSFVHEIKEGPERGRYRYTVEYRQIDGQYHLSIVRHNQVTGARSAELIAVNGDRAMIASSDIPVSF